MHKLAILLVLVALLGGCTSADISTGKSLGDEGLNPLDVKSANVPTQRRQIGSVESKKVQEAQLIPVSSNPQSKTKGENKTKKGEDSQLIKSILWTLPGTYWYFDATLNQGAIVEDGKRRELKAPSDPRSSAPFELGRTIWKLWDREVFKYYKTLPRQLIPRDQWTKYDNVQVFLRLPILLNEVPKSPHDWLREFADKEPSKVIRSSTIIESPITKKQAASNLSLRFDQAYPNRTTYLYLDQKTMVPLKIVDTLNGETTKTFFEYSEDLDRGLIESIKLGEYLYEMAPGQVLVYPNNTKVLRSKLS